MATEQENATSQLLSHLKGIVKQYAIYDVDGRMIASYVAPVHTKQGEPCLETRYGFRNINSTDITVRVENRAVWDPDSQNWDDAALLAPLPSPLVNS